jgi:anti-anti-sigma factor
MAPTDVRRGRDHWPVEKFTEREIDSPERRVIEVHGDVALPDVDQLQETLTGVSAGYRRVVVGLEDCDFIDSLALAALLRARDRLAEEGRRLAIAGARGQVRRVIEVSGLDLDGFLFDSVELALTDG